MQFLESMYGGRNYLGEEDVEAITGGTRRFWKFFISEWLQIDSLKGVNWRFIDYSPFNV